MHDLIFGTHHVAVPLESGPGQSLSGNCDYPSFNCYFDQSGTLDATGHTSSPLHDSTAPQTVTKSAAGPTYTMTREARAWSAQSCGTVDFNPGHTARDVLWVPEFGGTFLLEPSGTRLKATFFFHFHSLRKHPVRA